MSSHESEARAELRRHGLRATDQRVRVLAALMGRSGDVTAQALHEQLRVDDPSIGLATVYRALGVLAATGVVDALQHGHGTCWRHCSPGHHHHLTCTTCHRVVELHDCAVQGWVDQVSAAHDYSGVRHVVELSGTCAGCRGD